MNLLFSLLGCDPCASATCLSEAAVRDWPEDPSGVTARVSAIEDELTRTVVVGRVAEAFPGRTRPLCDALPVGPSRARCERINGRPHLAGVASGERASAVSGDVPADAPSSSGSLPERPRHATFPEIYLPLEPAAMPAETCAGVVDRPACIDEIATDAAISGDAARALGACSLHAEERWASECAFHAAETATHVRRGDAYPTSAALCGASRTFAQECLAHILVRVMGDVPALGGDAQAVASAVTLARRIRDAWEPLGAEVGGRHEDRFWALFFANVYREDRSLSGAPLDAYPPEVAPHVRAAVAMRLAVLGRLEGPLARRVETLRATLARRDVSERRRRGHPADFVFAADAGDPPAGVPSVYFLGAPRRPLGADEAEDLALCVLEAGARTEPPSREILTEAAELPGVVGADARRLLAALAEGAGGAERER